MVRPVIEKPFPFRLPLKRVPQKSPIGSKPSPSFQSAVEDALISAIRIKWASGLSAMDCSCSTEVIFQGSDSVPSPPAYWAYIGIDTKKVNIISRSAKGRRRALVTFMAYEDLNVAHSILIQQAVEVINYIFVWESTRRQNQPSKGFNPLEVFRINICMIYV
jgi:hypothetical protein